MYNGDRARKEVLVEHGFRLPSALDNRPMKIDEFHAKQNQVIHVSATPAHRELEMAKGIIIEQVIRPTGLLDPLVEVRKSHGQIDDLIGEIRERIERNERTLVTTLTKRMAEDLSEYLRGVNLRVRYLHSEVPTLERVQILRDLRLGEFDVLVGINLLREGLDLPEVSLVAVIDADKQGFLRSRSSLMQTAGRAARHVNGQVILYGDKISDAMEYLINESSRRRKIQETYNKDNGIEPVSIYKSTDQILGSTTVADSMNDEEPEKIKSRRGDDFSKIDKKLALDMMREEMIEASDSLDFERAAKLRDEISLIENELINVF
jgi:excinuclease ABC subunit B